MRTLVLSVLLDVGVRLKPATNYGHVTVPLVSSPTSSDFSKNVRKYHRYQKCTSNIDQATAIITFHKNDLAAHVYSVTNTASRSP